MTTATVIVLLVLCIAGWAFLVAVGEQGPPAPVVLLIRYGPIPFLALVALVAWVFILLAVSELIAWLALSVLLTAVVALTPRYYRRVAFRVRWTSVARAVGLTVTEVRPGGGHGSDTSTLLSAARLEWTPRIRRGRALPGGARYLVIPARGSSLVAIAKVSEELAAGLGVGRVTVSRIRPNLGELEVLW